MIAGVDVSRETHERLERFSQLVSKWTTHINLVSPSTVSDLWRRHIEDSAQLLALAPSGWRTWADLGSGGGMPGLVVAILASETNPTGRVVLLESDARKCAFLRTAARVTGVKVDVVASRLENVSPAEADVVSARALAPLPRLLTGVHLHLGRDGQALLLKGQNVDAEIKEALEAWSFACEKLPSQTDPASSILRIGEIKRV